MWICCICNRLKKENSFERTYVFLKLFKYILQNSAILFFILIVSIDFQKQTLQSLLILIRTIS